MSSQINYKQLLTDIVDAYDMEDKNMLFRKLKKASIVFYKDSDARKQMEKLRRLQNEQARRESAKN